MLIQSLLKGLYFYTTRRLPKGKAIVIPPEISWCRSGMYHHNHGHIYQPCDSCQAYLRETQTALGAHRH